MNVIVREGSIIIELLACKDEALLIRWDSFSVLDFGLDVLDAIAWLNFQCDVLSSEGFDEDLHECFWLVKFSYKSKVSISF